MECLNVLIFSGVLEFLKNLGDSEGPGIMVEF
jgi:hypothetical protein